MSNTPKPLIVSIPDDEQEAVILRYGPADAPITVTVTGYVSPLDALRALRNAGSETTLMSLAVSMVGVDDLVDDLVDDENEGEDSDA